MLWARYSIFLFGLILLICLLSNFCFWLWWEHLRSTVGLISLARKLVPCYWHDRRVCVCCLWLPSSHTLDQKGSKLVITYECEESKIKKKWINKWRADLGFGNLPSSYCCCCCCFFLWPLSVYSLFNIHSKWTWTSFAFATQKRGSYNHWLHAEGNNYIWTHMYN